MFFLFLELLSDIKTSIFIILAMIAIVLVIVFQSLDMLHIIQLVSYNLDQYKLWIKKNKKKFIPNKILFFVSLITGPLLIFLSATDIDDGLKIIFFQIALLLIVYIILLIKIIRNRKKKKPLKYTDRVKRNIICNILLYLLPIILIEGFYFVFIFVIVNRYDVGWGIPLLLFILYFYLHIFVFIPFSISLAPMITYLSYRIMLPIENKIKKSFIAKSKLKLVENENINVVGITGSYGKTSVKNFLYNILIKKYNTCKTPESYNTPMGVVLTINEHLKNYDDIFICEMGARRIGDIKEICDIVEPKDAIITDVGFMHLDTFHNIENVLKTKMELVDSVVKKIEMNNNINHYDENNNVSNINNNNDNEKELKNEIKIEKIIEINNDLKNNNIIILNGDNDYIKKYINDKNYDNEVKKHIFFVGENNDNDYQINNIKNSKDGTDFNVNDISFHTKMIGKNNIKDISYAIAYSINIGVDIEDIKYAVQNLPQIKNRLELINVNENTILINDAYNSNPFGAKNAIDVLSSFNDYKKILVTPGMVELGDKQFEENKNLSMYAYDKVDEIIIVGETNKEPLMEGAGDKGLYFSKEDEAINYSMKEECKKVILLENDLTDNY